MKRAGPWPGALAYAAVGASLGYLALHPYTMLAFGITERHGVYGGGGWSGQVERHLRDVLAVFEPDMLHMGIPYAFLGAAAGVFFGFWRNTERHREQAEKRALAADALASAVDAKSPWTRGHSENVVNCALRIAAKLGLSREETGDLRLAALLHDIGKIGTYDVILEKLGSLSEEEYAAIKKHPEAGANILGPIGQLEDIVPAIRHHHERWDGGGYPDGLKGEEIPLLARVISVADAYEAMTSERPYKPAMGEEYAIAELKRWRGVRFAPEVVDALLDVLEEKKAA